MSSVIIEEITDDEPTTVENVEENNTEEMIKKLKQLIIENPSMTQFKKEAEEKKAANRALLRRKLRAKINYEKGKRQRDMPENTEYDSNGKKIGRQQKEFIKIDPGEDPNDPATINKFLTIMRAAANNPSQKSSLLKVLNMSEERFDSVLEETKEVKLDREIQLEQVIV